MNVDLNKTHPSRKWRKNKEIRSTKAFKAERKGLDRRQLKRKATTFWTTLKQGNLM